MPLKPIGTIDLPEHRGQGGFDHAAVDTRRRLLFVAHTANDAVEVIDTRAARHTRSIAGLRGVAGALVDEAGGLVFTSNRGENTLGIVPSAGGDVVKVGVGLRPNGLAYDPGRGTVLCANVGDPATPGSASVTIVETRTHAARATFPMPGRTRWAVFEPVNDCFYVNIAEPSEIVVIDARSPDRVARTIAIPHRGPHGLDLDAGRRLLYCACDEGRLCAVETRTGTTIRSIALSGAPDVVFLTPALNHLYVAIGEPGVIDVIDVERWTRAETVPTERGAHTIAFDPSENRVYAFLPQTHRVSVYEDRP